MAERIIASGDAHPIPPSEENNRFRSLCQSDRDAVFGAAGEIDFMARAIIAMGNLDEASPTLLRAYAVRMLDLVELVTSTMEGHDTAQIIAKLHGVTA